jgi:pilus assembly protein CpaB
MDIRRILIAFVMAAIIAGGATYLVARRLQPPPAGPNMISIVAAARDLAPGVPLTAQDLTTIAWPDNVALPGSMRKMEDVIGRPLMVSASAKQPLLQRDLAAPGSGYGLSGKIPEGMRATAIRSNEIVGVAGFLFPGSHVDVIATYASSSGAITNTVLQDVEVISTGTSIEPDPQGKPQTVNVVTLLLTPEDSQKILLASSQGTIQFVLRSGVDRKIADILPTRMDQLSGRPVQVSTPAPPTPAPKPVARANAKVEPPRVPAPVVEDPKPAPYTIEVIQGSERKFQKLEGTVGHE